MNEIKTTLILVSAAAIFAANCSVAKQNYKPKTPEIQALYTDLVRMDSILFRAFNTRDFETIKTMFTPDLEFYHDTGGLYDYDQNMANTRSLFEGQRKVRRELVPGSLEVYPIKDYGAIQLGAHRFYNTEPGQAEKLGGTFKFLHIWKMVDGDWKLARVVSYDH